MTDIIGVHPWREAVAKVISSDIALDIDESNVDWEYLDGEMVKLGSLEHQLLDISKIQECAIRLLSTTTKDMRVLAHLLRTLQQNIHSNDLILAVVLLSDYIQLYWKSAAPSSSFKKNRLGLQILKRFSPVIENVSETVSRYEKEALLEEFKRLSSLFSDFSEKTLVEQIEGYCQRLESKLNIDKLQEEKIAPNLTPISNDLSHSNFHQNNVASKFIEESKVVVDDSNEKAWKYTLLKVADLLVSKNREQPIGYQLRRHTIWSCIEILPPAENNITPLAAISADMRQTYLTHLHQPNLAVWTELEYSLTLAPFWIEGHFISAIYAEKLGYPCVAKAIKTCTEVFLSRLPELLEYYFNDGLPFVSEETKQWLFSSKEGIKVESENSDFKAILESYKSDGLAVALEKLNKTPTSNGRDKFYAQLTACQLLEKEGMLELAQQNYHIMKKALEVTTINEWESSLAVFLSQKTSLINKNI